MNIFEVIIINTILILFPLLLFLFYIAYNQNFNKKAIDIILDFALVSSFYLEIRYGQESLGGMPFWFFNTVLLIAYLKKRYLSIGILTFASLVLYTTFYGYPLIYLIIEYMIYSLIFYFGTKMKKSDTFLINTFLGVKCFCGLFADLIWRKGNVTFHDITELLFLVVAFFIVSYFIVLLFRKGETIVKLHMTVKEVEQDKQVRTSLFKITHEIKNPIAVCKGYLDMFDSKNPEHGEKYVPIIKEEINRTLILLQDFLSMNKIRIEKEILDIGLLLEETIDSVAPLFEKGKISLHFEPIEDEVYLEGDYNRLGQVMLNIVKNAIEAMPEDREGDMAIWTTSTKNKIHLHFKDNGIGISKKHLDKIKEPFYTTKKNGTGLGVSLSYEIIEAHGGTIKYTSEEGLGTTVEIVLPTTTLGS